MGDAQIYVKELEGMLKRKKEIGFVVLVVDLLRRLVSVDVGVFVVKENARCNLQDRALFANLPVFLPS